MPDQPRTDRDPEVTRAETFFRETVIQGDVMTKEEVDSLARHIIALATDSLSANPELKIVRKDGETWFFFGAVGARGVFIKGCLNPLEGVVNFLSAGPPGTPEEERDRRPFVIDLGVALLCELCADLPRHATVFSNIIFDVADNRAMSKVMKRWAREARVNENLKHLLPQLEILEPHKRTTEEIAKVFADAVLRRHNVAKGRKISQLEDWELIDMANDYEIYRQRLKEIRKNHDIERTRFLAAYRRRQSDQWPAEWRRICSERVDYNIPLDILALLTNHSDSNAAAELVALQFSLPLSSVKTYYLPIARKLRKDMQGRFVLHR